MEDISFLIGNPSPLAIGHIELLNLKKILLTTVHLIDTILLV